MQKFKLTSWVERPAWFARLEKEGKALVNAEPNPNLEKCGNYEFWFFNRELVARLWTPDGIVTAYEGDIIVNCGGYSAKALKALN